MPTLVLPREQPAALEPIEDNCYLACKSQHVVIKGAGMGCIDLMREFTRRFFSFFEETSQIRTGQRWGRLR